MKSQLKLTLFIIFLMAILTIGTYMRFWSLRHEIGPFYVDHWLPILGASYILIMTSIFSSAKRFSSFNRVLLQKIHIFGNLIAAQLIFMHFAHHISRPQQFFPDLGTGLVSVILLLLIVPAGFLLRFGFFPSQRDSWRVVHVGVSISLFVVIVVHTLINFGYL